MKTVMFNPYTGTPRHPSDIASDPSGLLILEPGAPWARFCLENCRLYAARHRKEEWAKTILRFCDEAGVKCSPLRSALNAARDDELRAAQEAETRRWWSSAPP